MLAPFIQAYCNEKFDEVYKLMGVDADKEFRWRVILEEYSYLMKTEDGDHLFQLYEKILVLNHDISFVQYACYYLSECNRINKKHDPEVVERLSNIYPMDYSDPKSIELAVTMVDTKVYEKEILEDEYNKINGATSGVKMTEDRFNKEVAALSKYQGYAINKKTTTVSDYAAAYQNFLTEIKHKRKESS